MAVTPEGRAPLRGTCISKGSCSLVNPKGPAKPGMGAQCSSWQMAEMSMTTILPAGSPSRPLQVPPRSASLTNQPTATPKRYPCRTRPALVTEGT